MLTIFEHLPEKPGTKPPNIFQVLRCLLIITAFGIAFAGCGNSNTSTSASQPSSGGEASSSPAAASKPVNAEVSPACKEARGRLQLEASNPKSNPTYTREDREVVAEECSAAARAHWAEVKHLKTPEGQAEIQRELHSPKGEAEMQKLAEKVEQEGY